MTRAIGKISPGLGFHERIRSSWQATESMFCVGLDPDLDRFPDPLRGSTDAVFRFCREIVDATADLVCAFKPQIAFFSSIGEERALERICEYIRSEHPHVTLILDSKRGDVGSTAAHYAREAFVRYGAHVVTVNPYLGTDSVEPFFEYDAGLLVVCRTSNPGGDEFQNLVADGMPVYEHVARRVRDQWSRSIDCGLVVGATYPEEMRRLRDLAPDLPFLVPGVGTQGGSFAAAVAAGRDATGWGIIANSSRGVLYASDGPDFAESARRVVTETLGSTTAAE